MLTTAVAQLWMRCNADYNYLHISRRHSKACHPHAVTIKADMPHTHRHALEIKRDPPKSIVNDSKHAFDAGF